MEITTDTTPVIRNHATIPTVGIIVFMAPGTNRRATTPLTDVSITTIAIAR